MEEEEEEMAGSQVKFVIWISGCVLFLAEIPCT